MSFCNYCGRELEDGEVCNCTGNQQGDKPKKSDKKKKSSGKKKLNGKNIVIFVGIIAVIAVIAILVSLISSAFTSYQKPVKNLFKSMNESDIELAMESIYPQEFISVKHSSARDDGSFWADYVKEKNKSLEDTFSDMNFKKVKFDIVESEKVSGSDMYDKIKDYYKNEYECEVKKVYRCKVDMTFKLKGEDKSATEFFYVAKLKGEGWKLYPLYPEDYSNGNLIYINVVLNAIK